MLITGPITVVADDQERAARAQLDLPSDFQLVATTTVLHHDTGNGLVQIPLPPGLYVVAFENHYGQRRYGVVRMEAQR